MTRATLQMRALSKRLIAHEARGSRSSATESALTFSVCEKLRPHLATLVGNAGFHALLSRSLALASAETPWLRTVEVRLNGSLEAPKKLRSQVASDELREGKVVLLAHLLGLLVAFIGENLTLRLVHEIWPGVPLDDFNSGRGDENAKTK